MNTYNHFSNMLPNEIDQSFKTDLKKGKDKVIELVQNDLQTIINCHNGKVKKNSRIDYSKFEKDPHYAIKKAFPNKKETENEHAYYFAHWFMSKKTLEFLSDTLVNSFDELIKELQNVKKYETNESNTKPFYILYLRNYYDFNGYLMNIRAVLIQYNDHYVNLMKLIEPTFKDEYFNDYQSDTFVQELYYATQDLLLRGNWGRLVGISLLRSAIEVSILSRLFDLRKSEKYENYEILGDKIHLDDICNVIESLNLYHYQIDTLRRLYDWQSKVIHMGYRTNEYMIWFVYLYTGHLINNFNYHLNDNRDDILQKLENKKKIRLKRRTLI